MQYTPKKPHEIEPDIINHPLHHTRGSVEAIDHIDDVVQFYNGTEAYYVGNILKYLIRAPHKGNKLQDLKKAQWYMNRLVAEAEVREGEVK